jgi:hypothetical protein
MNHPGQFRVIRCGFNHASRQIPFPPPAFHPPACSSPTVAPPAPSTPAASMPTATAPIRSPAFTWSQSDLARPRVELSLAAPLPVNRIQPPVAPARPSSPPARPGRSFFEAHHESRHLPPQSRRAPRSRTGPVIAGPRQSAIPLISIPTSISPSSASCWFSQFAAATSRGGLASTRPITVRNRWPFGLQRIRTAIGCLRPKKRASSLWRLSPTLSATRSHGSRSATAGDWQRTLQFRARRLRHALFRGPKAGPKSGQALSWPHRNQPRPAPYSPSVLSSGATLTYIDREGVLILAPPPSLFELLASADPEAAGLAPEW